MHKLLKPAVQAFEQNVGSVHELLEFDRFVIEHVIGGLGDLVAVLEHGGHNNAARVVRNRVSALKSIER